jgi:hypothetical protein
MPWHHFLDQLISGSIALLEQRDQYLSSNRHYSWLYAEDIRAVKTAIDHSPYQLVLLTADSPEQILQFAKQGFSILALVAWLHTLVHHSTQRKTLFW